MGAQVLRGTSPAAAAIIKSIEAEAGTKVTQCYQCGKCTAGCPAAFAMDYPPRQIIRLLQFGLTDEALHAKSVWICASCETCSARCPREVDIASLMDAVRRRALKEGIITDKKVAAFNKGFLKSVKHFGRNYEVGLTLQYNISTKQFMKDMNHGLPMMARGKAGMFPHQIQNKAEVKAIFERIEQMGSDSE